MFDEPQDRLRLRKRVVGMRQGLEEEKERTNFIGNPGGSRRR